MVLCLFVNVSVTYCRGLAAGGATGLPGGRGGGEIWSSQDFLLYPELVVSEAHNLFEALRVVCISCRLS